LPQKTAKNEMKNLEKILLLEVVNNFPHGGVNNGFSLLTQAQSDKRALFTLGKTRLLVFPIG
jgi:hypothetical protein